MAHKTQISIGSHIRMGPKLVLSRYEAFEQGNISQNKDQR